MTEKTGLSTSSSKPLWQPSPKRMADSNMMRFMDFVNQREGKQFSTYQELHSWSIEDISAFWKAVKDFFPLHFYNEGKTVMVRAPEMRHTQWFPGSTLNFAENLLTAYNRDHSYDKNVAILELNELGQERQITYRELYKEVGRWVKAMRSMGIGPGDRVVGYLPNVAVTVIVMLATASLGAIWSSCSPDFGEQGVYDRFQQIAPSLIVAVDGYTYKGKPLPIFENLKKLIDKLTKSDSSDQILKKVVVIPYLRENGLDVDIPNLAGDLQVNIDKFLTHNDNSDEINFTPMPFSAPLYILYSSGTTGMPKCIMHGAGNTLVQHVKELGLHTDLKTVDKIFFYTTCGWMMWNWLVSSLFFKATVVLFEGNPFHPHPTYLLEKARRHGFTIFGSGARYYQALEQATGDAPPSSEGFLQELRTVLSTGSPLSDHSYQFIYRELNPDVQLSSISGGTDIVSCFVLGSPLLPVYPGEIQSRGLGMAVEVYDEGVSVVGKKGELVCTQPFPAMPIGFYHDPDEEKYRQAYFAEIPGVWCHGDYAEITPHDGIIIYGRSDTTLNPGGVRIGTAEIYRVVETFPQVAESVAVGWEDDGDTKIVLMLKLAPEITLADVERKTLFAELRQKICNQTSPRHVPSVIMIVLDIPRTVSGKTSEKSITDLINGRETKNISALDNPECLDFFRNLVIREEG